jgi:methionyl-tRNA synthetase
MPYGSKDLHFGHVGGVFVPADVFARFLRDRLGRENVIFVSGTDCYGSPIVEEHRKLTAQGDFEGSLLDFVVFNHERQIKTLDAYRISYSLFAASGLPPYKEVHEAIGALILEALYAHGYLERRTNPQFYDLQRATFLNGRQVVGHCPVQGCRSENAYADECSLGHQYEPKDLIAPRSTLSGEKPEMRDVTNWYVRTAEFRDILQPWLNAAQESGAWRSFTVSSVLEHFEPPIIHVTRDQMDALQQVAPRLPAHTMREGKSQSVQLVFGRLEEMEEARSILGEKGIRYRVGKTMVPFRLTGNLEWGLPAPVVEGLNGLTFWVWPESLWAPISFTAAYLTGNGCPFDEWKKWWCSKDAAVYQFIGEDNIYFYGLAEMAMFLGMQGETPSVDPPEGALRLPRIIANRHMLFLDKKASSSGAVKPPMARDLLQYYTVDQLRTHFVSMNLAEHSVSFRPRPFNPKADPREPDAVLKEGMFLSNAFNRAARSCFYTAQKHFGGSLPAGDVSCEVMSLSETAILDYEAAMCAYEFHRALGLAD